MNAQQRIEAALYDLTPKQREGLDASSLRNVLTDLWPAIEKEIEAAVAVEREACAKVAEGHGALFAESGRVDVAADIRARGA